jgi:rubrerythrin
MPKKPPLYPHVPKGRPKRGTNAWRCKQCGWTTWNVSYCPKCGSRDLEELTSEEVMQFYETGQPVIHPRSEEPAVETRPGVENLRAKLVEKMAEEMGARDEYYELATTADSVGRHDIGMELRSIGDVEHTHFRKLEEMERRLR